MATAMAETEIRQKLLRTVKKEVKQIMEEAVTRKFVHEDSSHIVSFCAAVEACVLHGLRRRAAGFLRSNKIAALFTKVGKGFPPAEELCRKAQALEQIIENKRNQVPLNPESTRKLPKLPNMSPQAIKHLWIRTALIEKVLDKIVLYLVENSSKFYEKEAVLMDPVDGPILASLLVGPCALEYTKMKTADHFWTDPSADELVQRHRIHSAYCRQDSPTKRPALCIQKRHSSSSMDERASPSPSARDYVESLHQNSRATLLFGKNNVLVQPRDDMEAIPGYLSLHQTADIMTLKWTPNQLMNGSVGDLDYERSVYWDYAMTIRLEEIVYLHCHQQVDSGGTVVLVSQDGIQRPPLRFPRGGHLLQFLSCLENGLLPHGQLDPPLWSQRGKGKVFPKLRKRCPQGSSESVSDKEEDEATDYVFRILLPGSQSEFGTPDLMDQGATLWHPTPRKSSCSSCSQSGSSDGGPPNGCNHERAPLKLLCDNMKYQIISRAFYGWLAYCRHLSTVRTHLSALVNHAIVDPDVPYNAYGGLTAEVWQRFMGDCSAYEERELLRLVYFGGVDPTLRKEVWPFLLGHYQFGMSEADRKEVDEQVRACYEQTMSEWLGCEAIVRQREKEQHAAALAKCSSGASMDSSIQKMMHRDSTVSNESSQSCSSDRQSHARLQSDSSSSTQVFESVEEVDQIETEPKGDETKQVPKIPNGALPNGTTSPDSGHPSSRNFSIASGLSDRSLSTEDSGAPEASAKSAAPQQQPPPPQPGPAKAEQAAEASPTSSPPQSTRSQSQPQAQPNGKELQAKDASEKVSKTPGATETEVAKSPKKEEVSVAKPEEVQSPEQEVAKSPKTAEVNVAKPEKVQSPEIEVAKSPKTEEVNVAKPEKVQSPEIEVAKSPKTEEVNVAKPEKVQSPEIEVAKSPKTEEVNVAKPEKVQSPEIEVVKSPKKEEVSIAKPEEVQSPEAEVAKSPKKEEVSIAKSEEVQSPEAEVAKSPEIEVIKSPKGEEVSVPEAEEVKSKSPEAEVTKSPEAERIESPKTEEISVPKSEGVKSPGPEAAKLPETEEVKPSENERAGAPKTEQVKTPEAEEIKSPKTEEVKSLESEVVKSPTIEEVRSPKMEVAKSLESEVKSPETEEVKSPTKEDVRSPKTEDAKSLETEVKSPETEEVKSLKTEEVTAPKTEEPTDVDGEVKSPEVEDVKTQTKTELAQATETEVAVSPETQALRAPDTTEETEQARPSEQEVVEGARETTEVKPPEPEDAKVIEPEVAKAPQTKVGGTPETEEVKTLESNGAEVAEARSPDPEKAKVPEGQDGTPDAQEVKAPDADIFKAFEAEEALVISMASSTIDTSDALLTIESDESPSAIEMEEIPMAKGSIISWDRKGTSMALGSPTGVVGLVLGEGSGSALPVLELRLDQAGEKPSPEGTESVLSEEPEMESLFPQFDSLVVAAEMKNEAVSPVSSIGTTYSQELLDMYTINLHRIEKDVQRCDRNYWYFTPANLEKLRNVMCSYVWQHLEIGYVQGMCDLLAPLLVILDDEAMAFSCFTELMKRMNQNFPHGGAMDTHFANMRSLIQILDSELFELMHQNGDYTHFYFCYRWFLLDFKRELVYDDVFAVWETIWAAKYTSSGHFVLFIALALVEIYRDIILENNMDFTDIIKFFNEMAEHHNIKQILTLARDLVCKVQTLIENK
ncbi:small G protein signaling modulator 1 isoform X1 [Anguilla rostrata]|uniref:small G protein signaling modulator 1 isoform X1 n=2 Tax=Anguilla rostrata TaxID=7938 RepID=UPI0030CCD189